MLRSMYSGISGMKNFQTKLDVVGNNISNVNTTGFKKGRMTFQDLMSQTTQPAQGSDGNNRGGINPIQVGTGSQTGTIDNVHTQGFRQNTERPLDLMIEGDGFFVLKTPDGPAYTRSGNFYLDDNGNLVDSNGYFVEGSDNGNINIPVSAQSFEISKDGTVKYMDENGNTDDSQSIKLATFSNDGGLEKAGENLWLETGSSGGPNTDDISSDIVSGALEMSNVDLSEEFTEMITAQRGFQANTRIITTSDEILQELVNLKR